MRIIYVDDEKPALDNFKYTVAEFEDIEEVTFFQSGLKAIEWAEAHSADAAFLDMEMAEIHGVELAKRLTAMNPDIHIVFVTAYSKYAIDAFGVDAVGYVLKPYGEEDIRKELDKVKKIRTCPKKKVTIKTIPDFVVYVDGNVIHFGRTKVKELFALFVDRGDRGISSGEVISYLWPERPDDSNTKSLFRVTLKRLMDTLESYGIEDILDTHSREKHIVEEKVDCDLYRIRNGEIDAAKSYHGYYMREYSWGEETNAQISDIFNVNSKNG